MIYSTARVATERPYRYLKQLVSHMGHRATTELIGDSRGLIVLRDGTCHLTATDDLEIVVQATGPEALTSVQETIARHLLRFAASDSLVIDWSPVIRPAVADDDAALLALDQISWSAGSSFPSARDEKRATFFGGMRTPDSHLVTEQDGVIVGYVSVHPKLPFPEAAHVYALWNLVVSTQARRRGIASALLATAERVALNGGATKLSLRVLGSNLPAQRLYERRGYSIEGRYTNEFLINGEYIDDVTMAKTLRPTHPVAQRMPAS